MVQPQHVVSGDADPIATSEGCSGSGADSMVCQKSRHRSSWCRAPHPRSCSIESSESSAKPCQGGLANVCAGKLIATRLRPNRSSWNVRGLASLT